MAEKKQNTIRVQNRQAWIDTFVYLCPYHRGGVGPNEYCTAGGEPYTNCPGRATFSGGGACSHVKQYFDTYCKFVRKELEF